MKVKIVAEMTSKERDKLLELWSGWTIESIVFEMVAPQDEYQDIEVIITD
jgi:hypothetical protein